MPEIVEYSKIPTPVEDTSINSAQTLLSIKYLNTFEPEILVTHCGDPIYNFVKAPIKIRVCFPFITGQSMISLNNRLILLDPFNADDEQYLVLNNIIKNQITHHRSYLFCLSQ